MNENEFVDEADVSRQIGWVREQRAKIVVDALRRRHMHGQYVATRAEALAAILALIPEGVTVFRADSVTLDQIGIVPELRRRNKNKLLFPQEKDGHGYNVHGDYQANHHVMAKMQREAFGADVFLTGSNAITLDGKIVSTDGAGNRVAPMLFGPSKVVVAVGVNKIVSDVSAAFARIHEHCAPVNGRRHFEMHHRPWYGDIPCVASGTCNDCDHERRFCNYSIIIEGVPPYYTNRISVILVGEELGI